MKRFLILLLIIVSATCYSQTTIFYKSHPFSNFQGIVALDSSQHLVAGLRYSSPVLFVIDSSGLVISTSNIDTLGSINYCRLFPTADSGFLMIATQGTSITSSFLIKLRKNLSISWTRAFPGTRLFAGQQINSNGILIAGNLGTRGYLARLDTAGNMNWSKEYSHPQFPLSFNNLGGSGGNVVVTGDAQYQGLIVRMDTAGQVSTAKRFPLMQSLTNVTLKDSLIIFAGREALATLAILALNTNLNISWEKGYNLVQTANSLSIRQLLPTPDGGYLFAGNNHEPAFLVKTDSAGNFQWGRHYGNMARNIINQVVASKAAGYLFAGHSVLYLGITAGNLLRVDVNGNAGRCDSAIFPPSVSTAVVVDTLTITAASVTIGDAFVQVVKTGIQNLVLQDTCFPYLSNIQDPLRQRLEVYPNPASKYMNVRSDVLINGFDIFDQFGRTVLGVSVDAYFATIDVSGLQPNLYFYRAALDNGSVSTGTVRIIQD